MTGWKKIGVKNSDEGSAPSFWSATEIFDPFTVATNPVPDQANLTAAGLLWSTRPIHRTGNGAALDEVVVPDADVEVATLDVAVLDVAVLDVAVLDVVLLDVPLLPAACTELLDGPSAGRGLPQWTDARAASPTMTCAPAPRPGSHPRAARRREPSAAVTGCGYRTSSSAPRNAGRA
jgi:hypothetical protein